MLSEQIKDLEQENIALKTQVEILQDICGGRIEVPENCEYCSNFIQHYVKCGSTYVPTCDGRCAAGKRLKNRKADETCKYFVKKAYGKNFI